jgi:tetratricopeptide (TPR) repeat protein
MKLEKYELAERDFAVALTRRATMPSALMNRAYCRKALGRFDDALADLDVVVRQDPGSTLAWKWRSEIFEALGDAEQAAANRSQALRTTPRDADDWLARGTLKVPDDPDGALVDLETAVRLDPKVDGGWQNLAYLHAEVRHEPLRAIEALEAWHAVDPDNPMPLAGCGVLHARLGQEADAREEIEAALALRRDPLTCYQAASAYALRAGQDTKYSGKAVDLLRDCLRQDYTWLATVSVDTDLDGLRQDKRFVELPAAASTLQPVAAP